LAEELTKRQHKILYVEDDIICSGPDTMIIDYDGSASSVIDRAKRAGMKVILMDGQDEHAPLVDLSISVCTNNNAQYRGADYCVVYKKGRTTYHRPDKKKKVVFVSVGDFDETNMAEFALDILAEMNINAIVTKSTNHGNLRDKYSRIEIYNEDNYYDAMHECVMGIISGSDVMLQALYYGLPCIIMPQNDGQKNIIELSKHCCVPCKRETEDIKFWTQYLLDHEGFRKNLSILSSFHIDGRGCNRICDLIEKL
jgi:spore coat polysaccharide biosynthesis predicted glycosyltransferase SpsG